MHCLSRALRTATVVTLAAIGTRAAAAVVITIGTDTATELSGTFTASGFGSSSANAVVFTALPNGSTTLYLERAPVFNVFRSLQAGTPDDSKYQVAADSGPTTLSGTYSNGGIGQDQTVNWSFSGLQDTSPGAFGGTFTGTFSFTIAAVPEPAETALAMGGCLAAFAILKRRNRG